MTEVLTYEALEADRDAQQKRADALAAENAERGEIIERLIGIFTASGYHAMQNSYDPCMALLYDAFQAIKPQPLTPPLPRLRLRAWMNWLMPVTGMQKIMCTRSPKGTLKHSPPSCGRPNERAQL